MNKRLNLKAKITTCVWAGTCFTLISAGSVLAAEPATDLAVRAVAGEGRGVSAAYVGQGQFVEDPSLVEKHREVDAYIFENGGLEKYSELGFTVTHTGPTDGVIEIGIAPYEDRFADELYAQFGDDHVVVVEGIQAVTYIAPADGAGSSPVGSDDQSAVSILVVGGPEPGEGEAAITSIEPDGIDLDMPVSDEGDILVEPIEGDVSVDVEPISAPVDGEESGEATAADSDKAAEAQLVSAPAEGGSTSGSNVWPWVAAIAAAAAGALIVIRKLVVTKK